MYYIIAKNKNTQLFRTNNFEKLSELIYNFNEMFTDIDCETNLLLFKDNEEIGYIQETFCGYYPCERVNNLEMMIDYE